MVGARGAARLLLRGDGARSGAVRLPRRRTRAVVRAGGGRLMASYVPLWTKTNGSFLEGASHPEELVEQAHAHGLDTVAVTDRDGVYGLVKAWVKAKELGLRVIAGAQATLVDGGHVVLLAESRAGYGAM